MLAGLVGGVDGFQRDAQLTDVVFVAFELALEARVVAAQHVALAVALHGGEDVRLGQADLGRDQREDEAEQAFLDGDGGVFVWGGRHRGDSMGLTCAGGGGGQDERPASAS